MRGQADAQSQGIKGERKQLNENKTFTAVWPVSWLRLGEEDGGGEREVRNGEDCGW